MERKLKIAFIVPDNRDELRRYEDPTPHFGTAPTALLDGFARLANECEVHVVNCVQRPVSAPEKIAPNIYYHTAIVPKWGWLRGGYLGCVRAVRRMLRKIQPDIVHGQGTERYCALSAAFSGFPNVVTVHGNMNAVAKFFHARPGSFHWLAARLETFTLRRAGGVVCISRYTQQAVASLAHRVWLLPNAVDASFFDIFPKTESVTPLIGLCVGTICEYKNQNDFIRALDPLAQQLKLKILFAGALGESAYVSEFRRLVQERPWCEHIGFINREQLKARLATTTFLAHPTREDNCPMVVLEAMAAGVPVLASAVGGVPDLIQNEVNGLLCDPQRPETFRVAVARFLNDPALAKRMAAEAKSLARQRFHPEIIARGHLQIYREVIK
jgi:glycosyltransferase involved in cell wall biosynthesis